MKLGQHNTATGSFDSSVGHVFSPVATGNQYGVKPGNRAEMKEHTLELQITVVASFDCEFADGFKTKPNYEKWKQSIYF